MGKIAKADLIDRLEMRNVAADYTAIWCTECLRCIITPREGRGKSPVMHRGSRTCEVLLKYGHLAECIRDLKGETEK